MVINSFDAVWNRITENEGRTFNTKRGLEFTYKINGNMLIPSRTNYLLPKKDFETAFNSMPIKGPGEINKTIHGPSYIWAILNDKRIMFS